MTSVKEHSTDFSLSAPGILPESHVGQTQPEAGGQEHSSEAVHAGLPPRAQRRIEKRGKWI